LKACSLDVEPLDAMSGGAKQPRRSRLRRRDTRAISVIPAGQRGFRDTFGTSIWISKVEPRMVPGARWPTLLTQPIARDSVPNTEFSIP
jgi:hypothetical protein